MDQNDSKKNKAQTSSIDQSIVDELLEKSEAEAEFAHILGNSYASPTQQQTSSIDEKVIASLIEEAEHAPQSNNHTHTGSIDQSVLDDLLAKQEARGVTLEKSTPASQEEEPASSPLEQEDPQDLSLNDEPVKGEQSEPLIATTPDEPAKISSELQGVPPNREVKEAASSPFIEDVDFTPPKKWGPHEMVISVLIFLLLGGAALFLWFVRTA